MSLVNEHEHSVSMGKFGDFLQVGTYSVVCRIIHHYSFGIRVFENHIDGDSSA